MHPITQTKSIDFSTRLISSPHFPFPAPLIHVAFYVPSLTTHSHQISRFLFSGQHITDNRASYIFMCGSSPLGLQEQLPLKNVDRSPLSLMKCFHLASRICFLSSRVFLITLKIPSSFSTLLCALGRGWVLYYIISLWISPCWGAPDWVQVFTEDHNYYEINYGYNCLLIGIPAFYFGTQAQL